MSEVEDPAAIGPSRDEQIGALKRIDEKSQQLQQDGELLEALQAMEKSLILRGHIFGLNSLEVTGACKSVAEMCNYLAMTYLANDDFARVNEFLKKAEVLTERHKAVRAITYNNFGCYYRKRGKLRTALAYVKKAVHLENTLAKNGEQNGVLRADTHLNMCTIQSELTRHDEAIVHAQIALKLLLMEMFGPGGYANKNNEPVIGDGAEEMDPLLSPKLPPDRVAVLAIAYHNLAVQQEHLRQYQASLRSYEKACKVVATHLEDTHPLINSLTESYMEAKKKLGDLIRKQERMAIRHARKQANRKGRKKRPNEEPKQTMAGALTSDQLTTIVLNADGDGGDGDGGDGDGAEQAEAVPKQAEAVPQQAEAVPQN